MTRSLETLTPTERAWLARHHGIVVRIECNGVATVWHRDGTEGRYAIETLKGIIEEAAA